MRSFKSLHARIFKIFLATPSDADTARKCVEKFVDGLNRSRDDDLQIKIVDGIHYPIPTMDLPQKVVLEAVDIASCDLFIGILWQRFGSPTGAVNPRTGQPLDSGTEEEFEHAYRSYQTTGKPRILFYRCIRPSSSRPDEIDTEQLAKVNAFFDQFSPAGEHPGYYKTFTEETELQVLLLQHLPPLLKEFAAATELFNDRLVIQFTEPQRESAHNPEPMSLLMVDIAGHSRIVEKFGEQGILLLDAFEKRVRRAVTDWGGTMFAWAGDGGIFGFSGEGNQYLAAMAGLEIRQMLPVLQLNQGENPAQITFEIRSVAHYGPVRYDSNTGSIHSETVNLCAHLLKHGTEPGEFCITEDLHLGIDSILQRRFSLKGGFEGRFIYVYPEPMNEALPSRLALRNLMNSAGEEASLLSDRLNREGAHPTKPEIQAIRVHIDEVYGAISRFLRWCEGIDDRCSEAFLSEILIYTEFILNLDKEVQQAFHHRLRRFPESAGQPIDLLRLEEFMAHRRRWLIVKAENMQNRLHLWLRNGRPAAALSEIRTKLDRFVECRDNNEVDDLFADLTHKHREHLVRLASETYERSVLDHLWERIELVLIEDLKNQAALPMNQTGALFRAILSNRTDPGRFRTLHSILTKSASLSPESVTRHFVENGFLSPSRSDLQTILKAVLVAHPSPEIRQQAIHLVDLKGLWASLAHEDVPLSLVFETARRLSEIESQQQIDVSDRQKVFFDCTRPRIEAALTSSSQKDFANATTILSLLYSFESLTEEGYWLRLEMLRYLFSPIGTRASVDTLHAERARLNQAWKPKGKLLTFPRSPEDIIKELPKRVQRMLANRGHYVDFFIRQDYGLASKSFRFLGPKYLTHLLKTHADFDTHLLHQICATKACCGDFSVRYEILRHGACPVSFAERAWSVSEREVKLLHQSSPRLSNKVRGIVRKRLPLAGAKRA